MIFGNEYDKVLELIINSEKNNKDIIMNFIESIPDELREKIILKLDESRELKKEDICVFDMDQKVVDGEVQVTDNCKYWFIIDDFCKSLSVGRSILNDEGKFVKVFEITLFASTSYNNVEIFGEQNLGYTSSDCYSFLNKEYDLIDTVFGTMVRIVNKNGCKKYKKVDSKIVSSNLNAVSLNRKNRLVKSRKI